MIVGKAEYRKTRGNLSSGINAAGYSDYLLGLLGYGIKQFDNLIG